MHYERWPLSDGRIFITHNSGKYTNIFYCHRSCYLVGSEIDLTVYADKCTSY